MDGLLVSDGGRNLERHIKIFGFEIFDLLVIFSTLSVLHLFLGQTVLRIPVVWGGTALLALTLFVTKRNKPENYLLHKIRYWFRPAVFYATSFDLECRPYIRRDTCIKKN